MSVTLSEVRTAECTVLSLIQTVSIHSLRGSKQFTILGRYKCPYTRILYVQYMCTEQHQWLSATATGSCLAQNICVCVFVDINSMPLHIVILHALHSLSFSFTITFTFNNHKTIVKVHYNFDNNILTSSLTINNIYIHSVRSVYLSTYLSFIVKRHYKSVKSIDLTNFTKICKYY